MLVGVNELQQVVDRFFASYLFIEVASLAAVLGSEPLQILQSKLTMPHYFARGTFGVVRIEAGATRNMACSSARMDSFLDVAAAAATNVFPRFWLGQELGSLGNYDKYVNSHNELFTFLGKGMPQTVNSAQGFSLFRRFTVWNRFY
jgi:hypothetical protein